MKNIKKVASIRNAAKVLFVSFFFIYLGLGLKGNQLNAQGGGSLQAQTVIVTNSVPCNVNGTVVLVSKSCSYIKCISGKVSCTAQQPCTPGIPSCPTN
jgi:hypothetical protein